MNVVTERHEIEIPSADAAATPEQMPDNSHWNKRCFANEMDEQEQEEWFQNSN
jgi:hypothetical protein